jgi:hypothetical protein
VTPAADVNWASIGITQVEADDYPVIIHDGATTLPGAPGPGVDRMQRHVTLTVVTSLYGPECEDLSGMLRDALYIPQNVEPLREFGLKLYEVRDLARNAEIVNQQWIDRIDIAIMMRRQVDRVYPVLNITGADVQFFNEAGLLMEVQV